MIEDSLDTGLSCLALIEEISLNLETPITSSYINYVANRLSFSRILLNSNSLMHRMDLDANEVLNLFALQLCQQLQSF
jgi:hypothetical protein